MAIKGGVAGLIGTIGAGKSTLAQFLKSPEGQGILRRHIPEKIIIQKEGKETEQLLPIEIIDEPVDPYARKAFYADIRSNTDRFEISQGYTRMLRQAWARSFNGIVIFDMTLLVGFGTYSVNTYREEKTFTHRGWRTYLKMIEDVCDDFGRDKERLPTWLESVLFYLKVDDVRLLQERQVKRGDPNDGGAIPLDYLEKLNRRNHDFVKKSDEVYVDMFHLTEPRIVTLDASVDININPLFLSNCTDRIGREIKSSIEDRGGLKC